MEILRVLIVEDLPTDAELTEREVRKVLPDSTFLCVETREDFLAALESFQPDFIISDYKLPKFDGMSALKLALEGVPELPFIILTGSMNESVAVECMKAGAWDYVIKEHVMRLGPAVLSCLEQKRIKEEKKQAEVALCESEKKFRLLYESSRDAIMTAAPEEGFLGGNQSTIEMFGCRDELEFITLSPADVSPEFQPDGRSSGDKAQEMMRLALEKGSHVFEWTHKKMDGTEFFADVQLTRMELDGRRILQATVRDITEKKRNEQAIVLAKKEWERTFEAIEDGIMILDTSHKVLRANKAMAAKLGVTPAAAAGLTCYKHVHATTCPPEYCPYVLLLSDGRSHAVEIHEERLGGYFHVSVAPLFDPEGRLYGSVHTLRDITTQKDAEKELKRLSEQISLILNSAGEGIYGVDLDGKVTFINPAAAQMLGYEVEELLGRDSHATWHHHNPDDSELPVEQCQVHGVLNQGITAASEDATFWKKDGSKFPVGYSVKPMFAAEQLVGAVVTFRDLTKQLFEAQENRKLEEQLRQAQKMEAIGTLAGGIAHDFNNILTAIMGYGEIVMEQLPPDSPLRSEQDHILKAGKRATDLVRQILTFSRRSEKELQPLLTQFVVKEALKLIRSSIPTTIQIREEIDVNLEPVLADPVQVHQLVMNLCTNAYQAMREKGGVLTVSLKRVEVASDDAKISLGLHPGPHAYLGVTDNGCGMEKAVQERIFEPYFTTKAKGEGTGLGLSLVHGIVTGLGGCVEVYSEPGLGTTFKIYLPLQAGQAVGQPELQREVLPGGHESILVVDDEGPIASLERKMLAGLGYRVTTFNDSTEALAAFSKNKENFDLIITDMTMPKLNGAQLAAETLRLRPGMPIILCTGYSDLINAKKARDLGTSAFMEKPLEKEVLAKAVRRALDGNPDVSRKTGEKDG